MSRSGVEAKPRWRTVPEAVRTQSETILGARVQRAVRVWGGYSPTPTYRLRLEDGRRAFFKGVDRNSTSFSWDAMHREERVYRELGEIIASWAPDFYGAFAGDGWHVMLLEDLGPGSAPPWKPSVLRGVARDYGTFHSATMQMELPSWLPQGRESMLDGSRWEFDDVQPAAVLAGERADEGMRWFEQALPVLKQAANRLTEVGEPFALLHMDTRSDNLRWVDGRLRLFDWPHVRVGPAEFDAAMFVQSVTAEGGPTPEQVIGWYGESVPVRPDVLDASVAGLAGFFALQAGQPEIPGLPRLRPFQKQQLQVTLAWAARRLGLQEPRWLNGIST